MTQQFQDDRADILQNELEQTYIRIENLAKSLRTNVMRFQALQCFVPEEIIERIVADSDADEIDEGRKLPLLYEKKDAVIVTIKSQYPKDLLNKLLSVDGSNVENVIEQINSYFSEVFETALDYHGLIKSGNDDKIVVLWGFPAHNETDVKRAVEFAHRLRCLFKHIHIGIHKGILLFTIVGSSKRKEYLITGEPICISERLSDIASPGQVLVSDVIYSENKDMFDFVECANIKKNLDSSFITNSVFELVGLKVDAGIKPISTIFGRDVEISTLCSVADRALTINGSIFFLPGEEGIGKSSIISEVKNYLKQKNINVYLSENTFFNRSIPYSSIVSLLKKLLKWDYNTSPISLKKIVMKECDSNIPSQNAEMNTDKIDWLLISSIFPIETDISSLNNQLNDFSNGQNPEYRRKRLEYLLKEVLFSLIGKESSFLILDNFNWADKETVDFINYLSSFVYQVPALISAVGSSPYLSESISESSGFPKSSTSRVSIYSESNLNPIKKSSSKTGVNQYKLKSLSDNDSLKLISNRLNLEKLTPQFEASVRNFILSKARGNPYYINEAMNLLFEKGLLVYRDGDWIIDIDSNKGDSSIDETLVDREKGYEMEDSRCKAHYELPITLQSLIMERISLLPGDIRETLHNASVIGLEFSLDLLKMVSPDIENIPYCLESLVSAGFLVKTNELNSSSSFNFTESKEEWYRFAHPCIYEVAYHSLVSTKRREIHLKIAEYLEKNFPFEYELLSYNYLNTESERKAIHYLILSGMRFEIIGAIKSAIENYTKALSLLDSIKITQEDKKEQFVVLTRRGTLLISTGKVDEAISDLNKAVDIADELNLLFEKADVMVKLGFIYQDESLGFPYDENKAINIYESAIGIYEKLDEIKRIIPILNLMGWLYTHTGKFDDALACFSEAIELSNRENDKTLLAFSISNLCGVNQLLGNYYSSLDLHIKAVSLAKDIDSDYVLCQSQMYLGNLYCNIGEYHQSFENLTSALSIAQKINDELLLAKVKSRFVEYYSLLGDFIKAREYFKECEECLHKIKSNGKMYSKTPLLYQLGSEKEFNIESLLLKFLLNMKEVESTKRNVSKDVDSIDEKLEFAYKIARETLDLSRELENPVFKMMAFKNVAVVCNYMRKYERAIEYANISLEMAQNINNEWIQAESTFILGKSYYGIGDIDKAMKYYSSAEEIAKKINNKELVWRIQYSIGKIAQLQNQTDIAMEKYRLSIDIIEKIVSTIDNPQQQKIYLNFSERDKLYKDYASMKGR